MSNATSYLSSDNAAQVVFGSDVTMTRQGSEITLHTAHAGGRQLLGRYASVADAWSALDELDAPFEADLSAAS